jgi:hypothetical protein
MREVAPGHFLACHYPLIGAEAPETVVQEPVASST